MAEGWKKGTVTPFSSLFTSEEAERAARRVEEATADGRKELRRLSGFISDNSALIQHVQKLPEELSYDIMAYYFSHPRPLLRSSFSILFLLPSHRFLLIDSLTGAVRRRCLLSWSFDPHQRVLGMTFLSSIADYAEICCSSFS